MGYKLGSLFDGSGGFPLAGSLCGITPVWASEVEPYPIAVTRSRFPTMKHLGDISKINGAEIEPVDIITFGSPCQDLSVAGKRAGLKHEANGDDETTRSGLFMEAVRIIKEMRAATNGVHPRFAIWENVPGAFSSNRGEDFRIVLQELIQIIEPDAVMPPVPEKGWAYADSYCGDGWSLAYRVLDAQFWGVPQRRRRIYLVVDFADGTGARKVLFERPGLRGYFAEGRTPWKGTAADVENGIGADDREGKRGCIAYSFDSLASNSMKSRNPHSGCRAVEVAKTLDTTDPNPSKNQGGSAILEPVYCGSFLPQKKAESMGWSTDDVSCTLHNGACAGFQNAVALVAVDSHILDDQGGQQINVRTDGKSPTLREEMHGNVPCVMVQKPVFCLQGNGIDRADTAGCNGKGVKENICYTLNTIDRPAVSYAVAYGIGNGQVNQPLMEERVGAMNCMHDQQAVCYGVDCRNATEYPEMNGTLQAKAGGGTSLNYNQVVRVNYIVRRLTPTECARLQGFADRHGDIDKKDSFTPEEYRFWLEVRNTHAAINGKPVKDYTEAQMLTWYNKLHTDSSEYKMWGNGIALPTALYCMQGIADALEEVIRMDEGKGWQGIGPEAGKFVPAADGFRHAAQECGITIVDPAAPLADEFKEMLVEWYFSGNWIEVDENDGF